MKLLKNTALVLLIFLPGCGGNIVDWGKNTFYQGKQYPASARKEIEPYLKTLRLYDQFTTLAMFDAIYLSDRVRTIYSQVYARMIGKNEQAQEVFLRRQLKTNEHYVSFYVLSLHTVPLHGGPLAEWSVYLEVDGKKYMPYDIKHAELPVEYRMFFGTLMSKHKQAYEIRFDRKDPNGHDILKENTPHVLQLFFSSPEHYGSLEWKVQANGEVGPSKVRHLLPSQKQTSEHKKSVKRKNNA